LSTINVNLLQRLVESHLDTIELLLADGIDFEQRSHRDYLQTLVPQAQPAVPAQPMSG
jgi:hypothetical protein